MQKLKLPKTLDPAKAALQRSDYKGVVAGKDLVRVAASVDAIDEYASIEVKFDTDAQGLHFFTGHLKTSVQLICQRCDEPFNLPVDVTFSFAPVRSEEHVDEIPDIYEPVQVNDHGEIDLLQIIEDEIILALPLVAMHDEQDCKRQSGKMSFGKVEPAEERPNPFAVLKELKRDEE